MKLMDALAAISESDLQEVVAEITTLEDRIGQLKEVRRVIELKLGIRKPLGHHLRGSQKKKRHESPVQSAGDLGGAVPDMSSQLTVTDQYRADARRYIMANGPQSAAAIAKACGIPNGSMGGVLKHKGFKQCQHGWELSGLSQ